MTHPKTNPAIRFSASIPAELSAQFDALVASTPHKNRSLEIASMIRNRILEEGIANVKKEVIGTLTLIYDHHKHHLLESLTHIQHDYQANIISTLHVHIDHHNCLEVLVVRGKYREIKELSKRLMGMKGILHGRLAVNALQPSYPA